MEEPQKNEFQLELPAEKVEGTYANFAVITHSSSEFVLDFARVAPGRPGAAVKERVVMAPEHAKRLMFALTENIKKYEQVFGKIAIPGMPQPAPGSTAMPFGMPKGEA